MLAKYGGTKQSERAVQSALIWLASKQEKNGSWRMNGPWADSGRWEHRAFATGMALLAFQGDGNSHARGPFRETVARGLRALGRLQSAEGEFASENRLAQDAGYSQAICTMALCDLYGMTRDAEVRIRAEKAIACCVQSQDAARGGWRYQPCAGSDTSVTGWVVMGLSMARAAGLYVPSPVFSRAHEYLNSVTNDGATYAYQPGQGPTASMTAEAMLCRQLLGWTTNDARLLAGAKHLLEWSPRPEERDLYYWYYGTQAMHNIGGELWHTWNTTLRDLLVASQEAREPEGGSWHPREPYPDRWNAHGGRLYTTCLSIYILETYYRYLPLHEASKPLSHDRLPIDVNPRPYLREQR
jgi:hypothetical protein